MTQMRIGSGARFLGALLGALAACAGGEEPPPSPAPVAAPAPSVGSLTPRRMRRLSNVEIDNVVADLVGSRLPLAAGFTADPRGGPFDTDAALLTVTDARFEDFATAAERVADFVTAPDRLATLLTCGSGEVP